MMKRNHTRLCASAAIAAALALTSTPLLAQFAPDPTAVEPAPVLVVPDITVVPPAEPTIVLPTELPQTPPPATVTAPERTTTITRTERVAAPAAPATRPRVAAPTEPAPVVAEETVEPIVSEPIAEPVAPVAVSEPSEASAPAGNDGAFQFGIVVLAAIAAFVFAIWGFIAIGRRKPVDRKAAAIIERPVATPRGPQPLPVMAEPAYIAAPLSTVPTPAPSLAHSGASIPLPRTIPPTFAARDALLRRMIAAKPDRANPFVTPKARLKRARLIIQSLGNDFADRKPWIDLSQYPGNWPELSRSDYAAA